MFFLLYCFTQAVVVYMLLKHYYGQTLSLRSFIIIIIVPTSIPRVIYKHKPYYYNHVSMFKYKQMLLANKQKDERIAKEKAYNNSISDITRKYHV